jgi:hypothetical protein
MFDPHSSNLVPPREPRILCANTLLEESDKVTENKSALISNSATGFMVSQEKLASEGNLTRKWVHMGDI